MSVSPSIFQKVCPACAAHVSLSAGQCRCGHQPEADETGSADDILRDEELYESYLAARVEQTRQAMVAAFEIHNADPRNADKKAALDLARNVAQDVEDDLRAQREKITALRNESIGTATRPKPASGIMPSLTPPAPHTPAARPMPAAAKPDRRTSPAPRVDGSTTTVTSRVAGVLSALKNAKARETSVVVPGSNPAIPFLQEQGAHADKIMENLASESVVNCPNCTATLPANTARCRCGYSFPASNASNIPSLTLCTSDFTALRNTFLKDLNSRR